MSKITVVLDKHGKPKLSKEENKYIFCKDGVYFTLNKDDLAQLVDLMSKLP